ncbi:GC-rich sequence DNA-binding factor domain containing protein [Trema orientale]|uniref:GC-rich sequence DNA-binding factor domain containing protein n=1 Tax=Trema orientale TaxID=63057 RepID=A0A2P5EU42_TREOI|nr:GC-rich sequence DNA-binding factor domain containing protein [Trema orientale]
MAKQKKQSDSLEEITSLINQVGEDVLMETLTLESLSTCFSDLQKKYGKDYKLCNLSCIACSFALPLFIRVFQDWDPLRNPSYGLELVSSWKALLQGEGSFDIWKPTSLYAQLLHEVVVPAIKSSRKLKNAVDSWEPQREALPIHDWVSPWLPLLGHKLEDVYQTLVSKLTGAWHPSADSAFAILSCWKTVFDSSSWERLMSRFVLPKLQHLLQEVQVNSTNQNLDRFHWFSSWAPVLPIHLVVEMMEKFFFPKWLEFLYQWLCSNPNFGQVTEWYFGWKDLLPKELLANEDILYQLKFGLDMMDRAVEGRKVVWPLMKENLSHVRDLEQRQFEAQQKAVRFYQRATTSFHETANMDGMSSVPELSLKEVVEVYAQQHGLLFKPKVGRMHNGLQIYGFGSRSIIVDSRYERVYAQMEKTWSLVTLKQLLDVHNSSHSMRY